MEQELKHTHTTSVLNTSSSTDAWNPASSRDGPKDANSSRGWRCCIGEQLTRKTTHPIYMSNVMMVTCWQTCATLGWGEGWRLTPPPCHPPSRKSRYQNTCRGDGKDPPWCHAKGNKYSSWIIHIMLMNAALVNYFWVCLTSDFIFMV